MNQQLILYDKPRSKPLFAPAGGLGDDRLSILLSTISKLEGILFASSYEARALGLQRAGLAKAEVTGIE
jgi:hypothetical protein